VLYLLDACALITLFKEEVGFEHVKKLIADADAGTIDVSISVINLLEVYYGFGRETGIDYAKQIIGKIQDSSISIVDVISPFVFHEAGRIKAIYKCSLADAIGVATAKELDALFVTSDHSELEPVAEGEKLQFYWLPPHPRK